MAVRLVVRASASGRTSADVVYEFDQQRIVIGRGTGADVRIPHRTVSEQHATIRLDRSSYVITDEGSTNGTSVGGQRLVAGRPKPLRNGDTIEAGGFAIEFISSIATAETSSAERTGALARRLVRELLDPGGPSSAPPRLTILEGPQAGERLEVPEPPARLLIGRGDDCDLVLRDADASRLHVELVRDLDGVLARDLESKNGIVVNDRVVRERRLRDRDELVIGATHLVYEDPAEAALRALDGTPDLTLAEAPLPIPATATATDSATATATESATATATESVNATATASATATHPRPLARPPSGLGGDLIIYILAAAVLAASVAALFVLLRAG